MDRTAALISGIAALGLCAGALAPAHAQELALRGELPPSDQPILGAPAPSTVAAAPKTAAATGAPERPTVLVPAAAPSSAAAATPAVETASGRLPQITGSVQLDNDGALTPGDPFADPFADTADDPFALPPPATSAAPLGAAPVSLPPPAGSPPMAAALARSAAVRKRARAAEDPWQPTGVAVGTMILRPAIDITSGYESNPAGVRGGKGSAYSAVQGALDIDSQWARDSFTAKLLAGYTHYYGASDLDTPSASANAALKLDLGHDLTADLELRGGLATQSRYSPNVPANVVGQPKVYSFGTTAGVTWKPNRVSLTLQGLADRYLYEDIKLSNGTTQSSADQNYTAYEARLRAGYDVTPDFQPFVQASVNRHQRDLTVDSSGFRQSSSGVAGVAGLRWTVPDLITFEGDAGYQVQRPDDPRLPDLRGPVVDASVAYHLSPLTTVNLLASSSLDDTTLPGSSGALQYTGRLQVDHALRRWLTLSGAVGFQRTDYVGAALTQDLFTAEIAVEWKLSRDLALRARLAHNRLLSSLPGQSYNDEVAELGVRLRR